MPRRWNNEKVGQENKAINRTNLLCRQNLEIQSLIQSKKPFEMNKRYEVTSAFKDVMDITLNEKVMFAPGFIFEMTGEEPGGITIRCRLLRTGPEEVFEYRRSFIVDRVRILSCKEHCDEIDGMPIHAGGEIDGCAIA